MGEPETMVMLGMIVFGALFVGGMAYGLITGIAAFNGTWRTWAAGRGVYVFGKNNYMGFFGLYLQLPVVVAILLIILGELGADWITGDILSSIVIPFMILALACMFRLPRFMLPDWYKDWLDRGANKDELLKPEYSSAYTWLRRNKNVHR